MGRSVARIMGVLTPLDLRKAEHCLVMSGLLTRLSAGSVDAEEVRETVCQYIFDDTFLDNVEDAPHQALTCLLLDWAMAGGYDPDNGEPTGQLANFLGSDLPPFDVTKLSFLVPHVKPEYRDCWDDNCWDERGRDYIRSLLATSDLTAPPAASGSAASDSAALPTWPPSHTVKLASTPNFHQDAFMTEKFIGTHYDGSSQEHTLNDMDAVWAVERFPMPSNAYPFRSYCGLNREETRFNGYKLKNNVQDSVLVDRTRYRIEAIYFRLKETVIESMITHMANKEINNVEPGTKIIAFGREDQIPQYIKQYSPKMIIDGDAFPDSEEALTTEQIRLLKDAVIFAGMTGRLVCGCNGGNNRSALMEGLIYKHRGEPIPTFDSNFNNKLYKDILANAQATTIKDALRTQPTRAKRVRNV